MKNLMTKMICVILMLAMLVPMMSFMTSATDELVNLYDASKAEYGTPNSSSRDGAVTKNANYYCSAAIEVKEGDVITMGPCFVDQGYYLTTYKEDGSVAINKVTLADCTKVDVIKSNAAIVKWTVPAGTASIKMATAETFVDCTLITKNQEFNKEAYIAAMDKAGVNIAFFKNEASTETLVNIFPTADTTFEGRCHSSEGDVASGSYRTSDYIPVVEGDIIYFGAAVTSQGYHLTLYNANKKATTNVNYKHMVLHEDIGRGYGIYAYRMRPGTAYVRIVAATGVYDDGMQFATLNQPFTGEDYRKMFNVTIDDTPTTDSPLKGLKGLFMGDSISFGSGDTLSYLRIGRAWAGRIQAITGLQATNASVGGAKVSFLPNDDNWVYSQYLPYANEKFDLIVMHGGVNDARHNRAVGTLSEGTDEATLQANLGNYAGGLEWMFYNVKKTNPDAKLFFIANHRLDGHSTGRAKNMSEYFNIAKEACEKWGIIFIDLYNNKALNDKLETTTTKYLPDTLHLNAAGYDIITPYIISALEAGMTAEPEADTTVEEDVTTAEPAPEATTEGGTPEDVTTAEATEPTQSGGCVATVGGSLAILAVVTLAGAAIIRKKND